MSLIADALQPLIVPELFSRTADFKVNGIADLLVARDAAYTVDFDDPTQSMEIIFGDSDRVVEALAASASRMSSASFQTMCTAARDSLDRQSLPWTLVKIYYSAFYAGHAVIALLGEGCSYFEGTHVKRLRDFADATGLDPAFQINRGLHRATVDRSTSQIRFVHLGGASGGMHEQFWDVFARRLTSASADVLSGPLAPTDAQSVFGKLNSLTEIMRRVGAHSWLSQIRNDVQYRHKHELWFPSRIETRQREAISRIATNWRKDPMSINLGPANQGQQNIVRDFFTASVFIISTCHALIGRIAERTSAGSRSFVQRGPLAFLNLAQKSDAQGL